MYLYVCMYVHVRTRCLCLFSGKEFELASPHDLVSFLLRVGSGGGGGVVGGGGRVEPGVPTPIQRGQAGGTETH